MWKDPVVEEARRRREEIARRFNYDIKAFGEALRRQQKASGQQGQITKIGGISASYCVDRSDEGDIDRWRVSD